MPRIKLFRQLIKLTQFFDPFKIDWEPAYRPTFTSFTKVTTTTTTTTTTTN